MNDETTAVNAGDEPVGYAEALAELEAILGDLDGDDVDVDRLAGQVRRAAVLIRFCRERIGGARIEIESAVAELDSTERGSA
jgi:exodeoxyribonuclease VII small subunit